MGSIVKHKKLRHKKSKSSKSVKPEFCSCGYPLTKIAGHGKFCQACNIRVAYGSIKKHRKHVHKSGSKAKMFGAMPLRRPGLFGSKGRKGSKKSKGRKGRRFGSEIAGEMGAGFPGITYPGTTTDYFGNQLMFVQPSTWWFPTEIVNGQTVGASPEMLRSAPKSS